MTKSTSDSRPAGPPPGRASLDAPFAPEFARHDVRLTAVQALTAGAPPAGTPRDPSVAVSDLAERVAASIAAKPLAEPAPGGFGVTQRWTLTRLAFTPRNAQKVGARVLVVRPTFIAAADLVAWRYAPPADALALPRDADAIVDGVTAEGATAFYAVLEATTPDDAPEPVTWQSLPLMPILPPFDSARAPFIVGEARARIAAFARMAPASPELAALIDLALRGLG